LIFERLNDLVSGDSRPQASFSFACKRRQERERAAASFQAQTTTAIFPGFVRVEQEQFV
jgi:hypothetical protein